MWKDIHNENFIKAYKQYNDKLVSLKEDNIKKWITSWNKEMSDELYEFIKKTFNLEGQILQNKDSIQTDVAYFDLDNVLITNVDINEGWENDDSFNKNLYIQIWEINSIAEEVFMLTVMRSNFVNNHYANWNKYAIEYINELKINWTYEISNHIGWLKDYELLNKRVSFTVQVTVSMFWFIQLNILLDTFIIN